MNARVRDNRVGSIRAYLKDLLVPAYDEKEADLIVRRLFFSLLDKEHSQLVIESQQTLSESELLKLHFAAKRIAAGEPTQYVIGHAPFMHWDFHVQPGVLIPRPETEELVSWIAERHQNEVARVLDIGVGSGCISIALKKLRPRWEVTGIDRSEAALEVARINANKLETPITLETMDVFEYSRWADWDIIVCNPPYIHADEAKDMAEHVVRHEPHEALFVSGNDPLLFYKHILKACKHQPKPERSIYFELPAQHALQLQDWIHEHIQVNSLLKNDMQDKPRMMYISL